MSTDLVHVPFHSGEILAVRSAAGEHVVIKPLCEHLGIDADSQRKRILRSAWGKTCTVIMTVQLPGDGQRREVLCLHRKRIAMWLATLEVNRVREEARPYLALLQNEAADVLDAYFSAKAGGGGAATDPEIIARRAAELVLRDIGAQGEHIMGLIRGARRDIVEGGDLTRELVGRTGKVGDQAAVARHNQMAEALRRAFLNLGTQGKEHASELLTAIAQTRAELAEVSEMLQGHPGITRLAVDAALRDAEARLVAKVAQVAAQDRAPGPIAGARVNTAGAAAILGIMPNTIRQRIRRGDEELRACVVLRRGMRDVFDVTKLQAYLRRMERA
jgi:hypothetical protein